MRSDISKFIKGVDTKKRILEIGPLDTPIFKKSEADVYYADVRSDVELQEIYKNEPRVLDAVPIDFVIKEGYAAALKDVPKFDYVVSCHVLEHMPRLIEFFLDIQKIMTDGGIFWALLPDHRYCFDHFRQPTSFAEAWYIHTTKMPYAPWRVMDHLLDTTKCNNPFEFWKDDNLAVAHLLSNDRQWDDVVTRYQSVLDGSARDGHLSVFTPKSFLYLTYNMIRARLFPWRYKSFCYTPYREFTFAFSLAACPAMLSDPEMAQYELTKIAALLDEDEKMLNGKTIQWV